MSNRFPRIVTAVTLGLSFLCLFLYLHDWPLFLLGLLIVCMSAWEWGSFISKKSVSVKLFFMFFIAAIVVNNFVFTKVFSPLYFSILSILFVVFFVLLTVSMLLYQYRKERILLANRIMIFFCGVLYFVCFVDSAMRLSRQGSEHFLSGVFLIYPIFLTVCADSAAYFFGSYFGGPRLASRVSPNKTFSGLYAGFLIGGICAVGISYFFFSADFYALVLISMIVVLVSVLGDLNISFLKRVVDIKDTGSLLPGHGGVLDRLDSVIPSVVFFDFLLRLCHIVF
jgi:phosphatidate cytidylyltransferase